MNKHKFIEYLRKPVNLNEQNLGELEKLIAEHPYFQSARTLLAKGSKINHSQKASSHINSAAIYATDRVLLKRYINDELIFLKPLEVHESHEADHERNLAEVIKANRQTTSRQKIQDAHQEKTKPATTAVTKPRQEVSEEKIVLPVAPSNLDHIIEELYRDMEELKINRAKFREIENKLEEDEAVDEAVKKATGKTLGQKEAKKAGSKESAKKPSESRSARKSTAKTEPEATTGSKRSTPKKSSGQSKKTASGEKASEPDLPAEQSSGDEKDKDDPDLIAKRKADQEDIVANFIKNNPSISPADGKKKIDEDLSGESTILHPDLASEYLAEIYLEQGKKETAKKIYENLIVKFPEKSVYFAEIIKKLN